MNNPNNPPGDFFSGYGSVNRSPSSARQPFPNTISMPSVRRQPPHNQPSLDFAQPTYDERYNAFDSRFDQRPAPSPASMAFPSGVLGNNQAWNYNGGAMTLNDARMGKMRPRAPLHAEWTHPNEDHAHYPQANFQAYDGFYGERHYSERREPSSNDLIPTAIVIKNIPFNVRKEHLTQTMVDMNLPQPYAFNYHFDKGVFRGLAFANFQSAEDTALVIKAMDGFEIQNRKLRVEYKKMLPEHERERIEREKREKRGQLEEQHRPLATQVSMSSLSTSSQAPQRAAEGASSRFSSVTIPSSDYPTSRASGSATPLSAQPQLTAPALSINLNDPVVLKYYIALHNFKESDKENLAFDQNLPPEDRRLVHVIAHHMGLEHTSYGTGDGRFVNVGKKKLSPAAPQLPTHLQTGAGLDSHPRGLSRAATFDHSESRTQQMSLLSANHRVGLNLHVPGSPEYQAGGLNSLRNIKSFADLRSYSPSPSPSTVSANNNLLNPPAGYLGHYGSDHPFGPSLTPTTPGGAPTGTLPDQPSLIPGFGSLSIGTSAFDSGSSMGRTRETPGAIGSSRPGANGSQRAKPNRQPAGPGDLGNVGFDRRTNGHMQRNSDSSDTTGRLPGASGASHF